MYGICAPRAAEPTKRTVPAAWVRGRPGALRFRSLVPHAAFPLYISESRMVGTENRLEVEMAYDDQEQHLTTFLTGLVLGAVIGAGAALLSAPESGRRTRRKLARAAEDVRDNTQDRFEDFADDVRVKVDDAVKTARKKLNR